MFSWNEHYPIRRELSDVRVEYGIRDGRRDGRRNGHPKRQRRILVRPPDPILITQREEKLADRTLRQAFALFRLRAVLCEIGNGDHDVVLRRGDQSARLLRQAEVRRGRFLVFEKRREAMLLNHRSNLVLGALLLDLDVPRQAHDCALDDGRPLSRRVFPFGHEGAEDAHLTILLEPRDERVQGLQDSGDYGRLLLVDRVDCGNRVGIHDCLSLSFVRGVYGEEASQQD